MSPLIHLIWLTSAPMVLSVAMSTPRYLKHNFLQVLSTQIHTSTSLSTHLLNLITILLFTLTPNFLLSNSFHQTIYTPEYLVKSSWVFTPKAWAQHWLPWLLCSKTSVPITPHLLPYHLIQSTVLQNTQFISLPPSLLPLLMPLFVFLFSSHYSPLNLFLSSLKFANTLLPQLSFALFFLPCTFFSISCCLLL